MREVGEHLRARLVGGRQTVGHVLERLRQRAQLRTEAGFGHDNVVIAVCHGLRGCRQLRDRAADPAGQEPRQQDRGDDGYGRRGHQGQADGGLEGLLCVQLHHRRVLPRHAKVVQEQARGDEHDGDEQGNKGGGDDEQLGG